MEAILEYVQQHVQYAPYIIFGLLLLAGFNLPVSEDIMLFTSAIIAAKNPEYKYQLFAGVFLGAYFSDLICYGFMGRFLGPKIFQIKMFASMVSQEKIDKVNAFYNKYGVITLILGRFIPFGIRNVLFFTAGLGKMNALKFSLSDLLACTISCATFFYLYFTFGESVIEIVKKGNLVIFGIFILALSGYYVRKRKRLNT
tara:strand:- start:37453 stop:38049 length:597 start_codon:yes stop_codon:yes gene_type:complete